MNTTIRIKVRSLATVLLAALLVLAAPPPARADPADWPRISAQRDGLLVEWRGEVESVATADRSLAPTIPGWPLADIDGARLPARLVALRLPDGAPVAPRIAALESTPWSKAIPLADQPIPQTILGEQRPDLAAPTTPRLPNTPLVVLRDGRLRGARIVVVALSPIFESGGAPRVATHIEALIPGASPLAQDAQQLLAMTAPFLASAPGPTNPVTARPAITLRISQFGIQRVTGAVLAAAGLNLSTLDPTKLHLRRAGVEVALELRLGADGRLDSGDELRFYAPPPGDRWNVADTYWLTVEATAGRRMSTRSTAPGAATVRTSAHERGSWQHSQLYDSLLPGPDGDHWFAADLKTGPGQPAMTFALTLTPTLPLAAGTTTLTVTGSAYTANAHTLQVRLGTAAQNISWSGTGNWTHARSFTSNSAGVQLALLPGAAPDGVEPDGVAWDRPVALSFGGKGAAFAGVAGAWRYQLSGAPSNRTLYDVTDPVTPTLLTLPAGTNPQFQDGPAPRQYLLAGPGTLQTPEASAHTPSDLSTPRDADVLYIAPAAFQSTLAPLVARRQAQGHSVAVIDVQAIYDAWSCGQVSPDAIRAFLRYAAAAWQRAPTAVTLVGDGTADPRDYSARHSPNIIPPYLAMVDPWIGETACEACYAQLDGDSPLADVPPDLRLGRLPVKSADELRALVAKIIGYETAAGGLDWRSRAVFVADNYREATGATDSAGDFAAFADQSAALLAPGIDIRRLYYDPSPTHVGVPWREPDSARAYARTRELLDGGAGLATYVGHSHQWQWAVTDPAATPSYLLELYDADELANVGRLPILLEMTCLTSAFQTPAYSGTTIDERLLLAPGGAVAIWGPTGLGVAHGHDSLMLGFITALWKAPPQTAPVGTLTMAGYQELFMHGICCQDTLHTFALLGDPLTPARIQPARRTYLPITTR
jgi:Peptidase family C25